MTKLKHILLTIIFILPFSSCGYTPIFSMKNVNFNIEKIEYLGNRVVRQKLDNALSSYKNKPNKEKKIILIIKSSKNVVIASKNSKGEAQTKRMKISANVKIIFDEDNVFERNFSKATTYTAVNRKSDQKSNENKLIENLSNEIAQQIIFEILEKTK